MPAPPSLPSSRPAPNLLLHPAAHAFEQAFAPMRPTLEARARSKPLRPRAAWAGPDGPLLGSIEPELAQALAAAGLGWACTGESPARNTTAFPGADPALAMWRLAAAPGPDGLSEALRATARWLNQHGQGGRWRDEALAVTDPAGIEHGRIERAAVRPLGIITFAVHLVGFSRGPNGEPVQWLQQRSLDKATDPGLWDTLMGGQRGAGETPSISLERETWEEAGLRLQQLPDLWHAGLCSFERAVSDGWLVEHIDLFEATVPNGTTPVNQDGEVERFEAVNPQDAVRRVVEGQVTLEAAMMMARAVQRG